MSLGPRVEVQYVPREVGPGAPARVPPQPVGRHELRRAVARRRRKRRDAVGVAGPHQPTHRTRLNKKDSNNITRAEKGDEFRTVFPQVK